MNDMTNESDRCSNCDENLILGFAVSLDRTGESLCFPCDDRLLEELDDFTSNH